MTTVAVTGASGFVGRATIEELRKRGLRPVALGRDPGRLSFGPAVEVRRFDPNDPRPDPTPFEGVEAVIHLAGESIDGRWTSEKKRRIAATRVAGTRCLVASLAACAQRPRVLVSASAVGYYGSRGDEPLFEASSAGTDFLAAVVRDWEDAAREAEALGVRTVMLRTGVVLGDGGALPKLALPFRLGAGGPLGSGRQFFPWIHLDDLVALYVFALDHDELHGAVNAVAPDYPTNARFALALGAALGRPALVPAPSFALRAVLGEFADTVLASQLVIPAVAADAGFVWRHPQLESALIAILDPRRRSRVRQLRAELVVPRALDEVYAFFANPLNLERITPPLLHFGLQGDAPPARRGAVYEYRLRLRGLPLRWKTLIAEQLPGRAFVDVQLRGPYALWRHRHEFRPVEGGVQIDDAVDYVLPLAPFGELFAPLIERDLRAIFAYRNRRVGELLGAPPALAAR